MTRKHRLAIWFGSIIAALVAFGATYPRWFPPTPDTAGTAGVQASALPASGPTTLPDGDARDWAHLTRAEQEALAPLAGQWDGFTDQRKIKWLKIAERYARMSAGERQRLHARMNEWIHISPEQRRAARDNYLLSKRLGPVQREHAWQAYQKLPEDQKKKLAAAEHRNRRPTVVSAPPAGIPPFKEMPQHGKAASASAAASGASGLPPAGNAAPGAPPAATAMGGAGAAGATGATGQAPAAGASAASAPAASRQYVPLLEQTLH